MSNITGEGIITKQGLDKLAEAVANNTQIRPTYFKVTSQDIDLDPYLDPSSVDWWRTQNINSSQMVDEDNAEFVCVIEPTDMVSTIRAYGLFLEDDTLFMIEKPPFEIPAKIKTTERIRLQYANAGEAMAYVSYNDGSGSFGVYKDVSEVPNHIVLSGTSGVNSLSDGMSFVFSPKYDTDEEITIKTGNIETSAGNMKIFTGEHYIATYSKSNNRFNIVGVSRVDAGEY